MTEEKKEKLEYFEFIWKPERASIWVQDFTDGMYLLQIGMKLTKEELEAFSKRLEELINE